MLSTPSATTPSNLELSTLTEDDPKKTLHRKNEMVNSTIQITGSMIQPSQRPKMSKLNRFFIVIHQVSVQSWCRILYKTGIVIEYYAVQNAQISLIFRG